MANFETLIRNALASQSSTDENVRRKVYNSSKNALEKMIAANRNLTLEEALKQRRALEQAVIRIEQEYTAPPPEPELEPVAPEPVPLESAPVAEPVQQIQPIPSSVPQEPEPVSVATPPPAPQAESLPVAPAQSAPQTVASASANASMDVPPPSVEPVLVDESPDLPPEFSNRRRKQRRSIGIIIVLLVLALLAWVGYYLFTGLMDGSLLNSNGQNQSNRNANTAGQSSNSEYITILEPSDTSSLITAGRGTAEIVNRQNQQMLSLTSLRDENDREKSAKSILLRLKPGVIEKIQGRNVTVEIFARSGSSGPAQFAIECQFGILGNCGRKRFRIGLQPEAVVFSIRLKKLEGTASDAFFAINTDITSSADISGIGDTIDIAYARLRTTN